MSLNIHFHSLLKWILYFYTLITGKLGPRTLNTNYDLKGQTNRILMIQNVTHSTSIFKTRLKIFNQDNNMKPKTIKLLKV